jgi:hypothetical protein
VSDATETLPPAPMPPGEYAIVELFGHTTLVGRIAEVERFGAKMLAIECLFQDALLPAVFHGGAAIYRLTPCSAEVAFARQPRHDWQVPPSIRCIIPTELLPAPTGEPEPEEKLDRPTFDHDDEPEDEPIF